MERVPRPGVLLCALAAGGCTDSDAAPPGARFVDLGQGNNSAIRTTREAPVEEYFRIWEAPPLSEDAG